MNSVLVKGLKKVELEAMVLELNEKLQAASTTTAKRSDSLKWFATVAMGCVIPLLSLAMSKVAGELASHEHIWLSVFALSLMVAVLAVSLPHLKWAIGDITRSEPLPSWCLAIALDLSLVLCETVLVYGKDAKLEWVVIAVMATVCIGSMFLNCWAFLKAPQK